jgi:RHS repeat-associated protein
MPFDAVTDLNFAAKRPYDPSAATWLKPDPSGFGGGQANLSEFCGNSPTNGTDPTGLAIYLTPPSNELGAPGSQPSNPATNSSPAFRPTLGSQLSDPTTGVGMASNDSSSGGAIPVRAPNAPASPAQAELDKLYAKALEWTNSHRGLFDGAADCNKQADGLIKFLTTQPHKYWNIDPIYGQTTKNGSLNPFAHENAVQLSPKDREVNPLGTYVIDPFVFYKGGSPSYPGLMTEAQFRAMFPYADPHDWWDDLDLGEAAGRYLDSEMFPFGY